MIFKSSFAEGQILNRADISFFSTADLKVSSDNFHKMSKLCEFRVYLPLQY
jgi:hypothetical protein